MVLTSDALAENIKRTVDGLAREIARRVEDDWRDGTRYGVEHHARLVLLDWFLGDYIPPR